jgi:hypothetical protein
MVFTGVLELWLVQRVSIHTHQLLSSEELELADLVRAKTGPLDRFLTARVHNHFVAVRGVRPVLMGYGGWVWNYGFDFQQTERDMELMYRGGDAAIPLLRKHRVSYVVIGPAEMHEMKPDVGFFRTRFPLLAASSRFLIFDVRAP